MWAHAHVCTGEHIHVSTLCSGSRLTGPTAHPGRWPSHPWQNDQGTLVVGDGQVQGVPQLSCCGSLSANMQGLHIALWYQEGKDVLKKWQAGILTGDS